MPPLTDEQLAVIYTRSQALRVICGLFSAITTLFVAARLYSRVPRRQFGADDALICCAMAASWASSGFLIRSIDIFESMDLQNVYDYVPELEAVLKMQYFSYVSYYLSFALFCKTSVVVLYLRIFRGLWYRRVTWGVLGFIVACGISFTLSGIFTCVPIDALWTIARGSADEGTCIDERKLWYAYGATTILTDIALICLPVFMVRKLQLPRKEKLILSITFCLGLLSGTVASLIRLLSYDVIKQVADLDIFGPHLHCSVVEENLGIVCSCILTLRAFVSKALSSKGSSSGGLSYPRSHGFRSMGYGGNRSGASRSDATSGAEQPALLAPSKDDILVTYDQSISLQSLARTHPKDGPGSGFG